MKKQIKYTVTILVSLLILATESCDLNSSKNTLNNSTIVYNKDASLKLTNYEFESGTKEIKFSIEGQEKTISKNDSSKTVSFENLTSGKEIKLTVKTIFDDGTERTSDISVSLEAKKINSFKINDSKLYDPVFNIIQNLFDAYELTPNATTPYQSALSENSKTPFSFIAKPNMQYVVTTESLTGDVDLFGNTQGNSPAKGNVARINEVKLESQCYSNPTNTHDSTYNKGIYICTQKNGVLDSFIFTTEGFSEEQRINLLVSNSIKGNSTYKISVKEYVLPNGAVDTEIKENNLKISGWAESVYGIKNIEILVNGKSCGKVTADIPRADKHKGFVKSISLQELIALKFIDLNLNENVVTAVLSDNQGRTRKFKSVVDKSTLQVYEMLSDKMIDNKNKDTDIVVVNGINTGSGLIKSVKTTGNGTTLTGAGGKTAEVNMESEYLGDAVLDLGDINKIKNTDFWSTPSGLVANIKDLENYISSIGLKNVRVKGVYNPTGKIKFASDLKECFNQICKSEVEDGSSIRRVIDGIKLSIESSIIIDNRNVILLPHSQGNFFVNKAIDEMLEQKFVPLQKDGIPYGNAYIETRLTKDKLKKSLVILGLGSPNRVTGVDRPNTFYISNSFDMVSWISGLNSQNIVDTYSKNNFDLNSYFEYTFVVPSQTNPTPPTYKVICTNKDKILDILKTFSSNISDLTFGCYNSSKTSDETNSVVVKTMQYGSIMDLGSHKCTLSDPKNTLLLSYGSGFTKYHPLKEGYLDISETRNEITKKLNYILGNILNQ